LESLNALNINGLFDDPERRIVQQPISRRDVKRDSSKTMCRACCREMLVNDQSKESVLDSSPNQPTCSSDTENSAASAPAKPSMPAMGLAALGIVFGDIGTSPLYTLKTVLGDAPSHDAAGVLGILSLVIWTLVIITTLKYVVVAMSIDNDGEGGILALMSLIGIKKQNRPAIIFVGLFGAALIYGDGAVTPAISVLSALEGLNIVTPDVQPYVLPGAVAILTILFLVQPFGTQKIGRAFGPIMALWFLTIAVMGAAGIARHLGSRCAQSILRA